MFTPRRNISDAVKTSEKSDDFTKNHNTSKTLNKEKLITVNDHLNYIIRLEEESIKKYNGILQEVKEIKKAMTNFCTKTYDDNTIQSVEESVIEETNVNDYFPLNDNYALEALEEKLENKVFQKNVITLLAKRGGRNACELTNNILSKVFTSNFATQYSYYGKQKKKALSKLKITKCIIETVTHSCQNIKEHDVERKIRNWLANAPTRVARERLKKEVKSKKNEENVNQNDDEEELDNMNCP